jgi:hypothetical protein
MTTETANIQLLAQGADWMESVVVLGFIALSVVGNIANAWIKRIKENRENQQQSGKTAVPPIDRPGQATRQSFPAAKPRVPQQSAPRPPVTQPLPPPSAPQRPPAQPAPPRTSGIPRELLPEGLEEVLGEILPDFLQPKKPAPPRQRPAAQQAPPKPLPAQPAPPQARKQRTKKKTLSESDQGASYGGAKGVAKRLGTLQSSFESMPTKESTVAAHVASHISHLEHPVPDAVSSETESGRKKLTRAELRRAIVMSEILGKPRALRPLEDLY